MIRFQNESAFYAIDSALLTNHLLLELPTAWYEVTLECPLSKDMAQQWISSKGDWKHGSGNSGDHNQLGMAYAWWATEELQRLSVIKLGDSPDFLGEIPIKRSQHKQRRSAKVAGDIGKCSMLAFMSGFEYLAGFHSCWISVLDEKKQILIEFGYDPQEWYLRRLYGAQLAREENPNYDPKEDLRKIFYCEECKSWSLTKQGRVWMAGKWKDEVEQNRRRTAKAAALPNPEVKLEE